MRKGEKLYNQFREWAMMHYEQENKNREVDYMAESMIITPMIAMSLKNVSDEEFDRIIQP